MAKAEIQWDLLEGDWAAGIKSPRQMASDYKQLTGQSVSHEGIRKHFDEVGLKRDLQGKIKQRAQELVDRHLTAELTKLPAATEKQVVEVAARTQAEVILRHRSIITKLRDIVEGAIDQLPAEDLSARIDGAKKISETMKTMIGLERQAFGLSDNSNGEADKQPEGSQLAPNDAARRVAFMLTQALKGN